MRKKYIKSCILFAIFLWSGICYAQDISIQRLLDNPRGFNAKQISIQGEVIGEPLKTKDGTWINLSQNGYAIGVFTRNPSMVSKIHNWGDYDFQGDLVRASGVFYMNSDQHQERAVYMNNLEIISRGYARPDVVSKEKKQRLILLAIICLTLLVIYSIVRKVSAAHKASN